MKNILFRVDSSSTIGTGHVMRDLVLADQFKGSEITFAVQDLDGNINHRIIENKHALKLLESNDVNEVIALVKELNIDLIVIDHYGIYADYEKALKDATLVQIMSFDDTYEKHYCDILLNHNVYADKLRYQGLVPDYCELRCGSEFTLLREEFKQVRRKKVNLNPRSVLIAMGGADTLNQNIKILNILEGFQNLHAHVVTTASNQHLTELQSYARNKENVTLHLNTCRMAQLMADVDFAILTPSVTINEALHVGVPFVSIKVADNQSEMHDYLIEKNYLALSAFDKVQLVEKIKVLINSLRVKLVNFINLPVTEKKLILEWRNHPSIRKWMFSKDEISLAEHMGYMESLKQKKDRVYFMVSKGRGNLGVVDLTNIDSLHKSANLGIYANPQLRGVGELLMCAILDYGFQTLELKSIVSEVYVENKSAVKLYERCGFKRTAVFKYGNQDVLRMELSN